MTASVVFTGWKPGLRKVALGKLLQEHASMSLYDAHQHVSRLTDGATISIVMPTSAAAYALARQAAALGAVVEVSELDSGDAIAQAASPRDHRPS